MSNICKKCGKTHIIHVDNMDVCDDCMSTVVFDDSGDVLSIHTTSDFFAEYYNSVRSSISEDNQIPEEACKKLLSMAIDIPTMLNTYGICLVNKGDYDNSIKYFRKAIEINPGYGAAYCNMAKVYYAKGDFDGMLQNLKRAEKYIFPEDYRYKDFMGAYAYALAAKGMVNSAEDKLRIAEKYGYENGVSVRNILNSSNTNLDEGNTDTCDNIGVTDNQPKTKDEEVNTNNRDKKPWLNKDQISIDVSKTKILGDWKTWILIALGIVVLLFVFSAKFRDLVLGFIVWIAIIGIIVLMVVWFIKDPVGFLEAALSSSPSVGGGGRIKIRQGQYSHGEILYTFDGKNIKKGQYSNGEILYTFDGKNIKKGQYSNGEVLYTFDGKYVKRGPYSNGEIIYNYDGKYVKQGPYSSGNIIYNIDRS